MTLRKSCVLKVPGDLTGPEMTEAMNASPDRPIHFHAKDIVMLRTELPGSILPALRESRVPGLAFG